MSLLHSGEVLASKRFRNLSYEEQGYAASSIEWAASGSSPDFVRLARRIEKLSLLLCKLS
jgi:hypothetical protein